MAGLEVFGRSVWIEWASLPPPLNQELGKCLVLGVHGDEDTCVGCGREHPKDLQSDSRNCEPLNTLTLGKPAFTSSGRSASTSPPSSGVMTGWKL